MSVTPHPAYGATVGRGAAALVRRRPEVWAAAGVALAWVALVAAHLGGSAHHAAPAPAPMEHAGHAAHLHGGVSAPAASPSFAGSLALWVLMTLAMMGPVLLPAVRHVALNSLRWRRQRAVAAFLLPYLLVWAAVGAVALGVVAAVPGARSVAALAAILAVAAAWQVSPFKRRALLGCHRTVPLPPRGWKATAGCATFGLRHGLSCVASCWALMLVMAVSPAGHLLWTVGLTAVVCAERYLPRPRRTSRRAAAVLAAAAAGAGLAAAL
jgi:predicted metal-binding membrane protein